MSEKDVHTEHCCDIHGCKYGYDAFGEKDCTVSTGLKKQSHICEYCSMDHEQYVSDYAGNRADMPVWYEKINGELVKKTIIVVDA